MRLTVMTINKLKPNCPKDIIFTLDVLLFIFLHSFLNFFHFDENLAKPMI